MRHFISFQKNKALYLEPGDAQHTAQAHALNHELMRHGFVLSQDAFALLASQPEHQLKKVHDDLVRGIARVVGQGDDWEPIYRNFPQSVLALSYEEFMLNALVHYWSAGAWRPQDQEHLKREFAREPTDFKRVGVISKAQFDRIFTDLLYANVSLSAFDKQCVDWHIAQGGALDFARITFNETAAHVGKRMMESALKVLPTRRATTVLRIWSAYCGGDEGLKQNTRFLNPKTSQRRLLMATLEQCTDLEDSFKTYREKWLRVLFTLHPTTRAHQHAYPQLAAYTERLRNDPKSLRTFSAKIEHALMHQDPEVFELLSARPGVFMRRLDHLVRMFGLRAVQEWLKLDVRFEQLVTVFNHFGARARPSQGRSAVLAGQGASELVTYAAQQPLEQALVDAIQALFLKRLETFKAPELAQKKTFIHPSLYYSPLATNNRASSLSLDSKVIGKTQLYEQAATLRMYVHWEGKHDIDLSGFIMQADNQIIKVGWNGAHQSSGYVVYSGDNTGLAQKNAEYLDLNTPLIGQEVEWIIVEARIYRGPETFAGFEGRAHIGWMSRQEPDANRLWLPQTLQHAMVLSSASRTAYLMAYHPATRTIVYLDMAMGAGAVSTAQDAIRMRIFLNTMIDLETENEVAWDRLHQGHLIEMLAGQTTGSLKDADVVFDDNTPAERVSLLMSASTRTP